MSIPYTGVGGYFNRQGAIVGEFNRVAALYGTDLTTGFNSIWAQFASSDQAAVNNLPAAVAAYAQSGQAYLQTLQQDGTLAAILQTQDYYSVVPATLQQSFIVIAAQMKVDSQTIQRATLTSTVTDGGSNVGNAKFILSTINQFGDPIDTTYAETITTTCTSAATNYQEVWQAVGQATVSPFSASWPAGSGANVQITTSDPAVTGLLVDGGFEVWGGTGNNTPTNWTIINGAPGVTVFRGTGGVRGNYTAVLTSDGTSLTALTQSWTPTINTVYAVSVQAKMSSTDGSGNLMIAFTDGDGNILDDDAGNPLSKTVGLNGGSGVGTGFGIVTAFFAMPRTLPTEVLFQVGYGTTAPTAAKSLTLDLAGLVIGTQLYGGGPYAASFAQDTPNSAGDVESLAFTNSLTSKSFALGMNRLYLMSQMANPNTFNTGTSQRTGVYFPSANSPSISDSLVTH